MPARPYVSDQTRLELERLGLVLRELHEQVLAVESNELWANLKPEVAKLVDHRLRRIALRLEREAQVARRTNASPIRLRWLGEAEHELVRGTLVQLARSSDLFDPPAIDHDDEPWQRQTGT